MDSLNRSKNFQELCSERFGRPAVDYEKVVFWWCLYEHASIPARIIHRLNPDFFRWDFELLRTVGKATDLNELSVDLNNFRYQQRSEGLLRGLLRVRISGQRVLNLGSRLFAPT